MINVTKKLYLKKYLIREVLKLVFLERTWWSRKALLKEIWYLNDEILKKTRIPDMKKGFAIEIQ